MDILESVKTFGLNVINSLNLSAENNFLFFLVTANLMVIFLLYFMSTRRQKRYIETAFKQQEKMNQCLNLLIKEAKRSNRYLAELSNGGEPEEYLDEDVNTSDLSAANSSQFKLYVGNIDYTATESELASYFSQYGKVEFVNIPVNRYTGKTRGFGFVTFNSQTDAERARALHGTEFKGRQIQVNFAKERELIS